jgi:DNA-binding SARP family transcriptional activator/WD40 repeat protein
VTELAAGTEAGSASARLHSVRVLVLGPLAVEHEGREVHVAGSHRRRLLAFLASRAARPASADAIAEALWGDDLPPTTTKSIQNHVARLRRSLAAVDGEMIETNAWGGYRLAVDPGDIDAVAFEQLAAEGRRRLATGDTTEAAAVLEDALRLWRGPAYADLADASFAIGEAARLDELRCATAEDLAEARIECSSLEVAIADLEGLVREQPGRERSWGLLIRALYAAGRQRDALAAYQRARTVLAEEFGLEPGAELRDLERRVLEQDPALTVRRQPSLPTTLRRHAGPLVGRAGERAWLGEAWQSARAGSGQVRVLLGSVDSGRTRLAADLASTAVADGAHVVYIRGEEGLAADTPGAFVDAVIDRSRAAPILVVIDDAEWSSARTLTALTALVGAVAQVPVLLVLIADPSAAGAALQALYRLADDGAAASRALDALDDEALAAIVAADGVDHEAVAAVVAVARGLPGVARREAAAWAERAASERLTVDSASSIGATVAADEARASVFDDVVDLIAARARRDDLTSRDWAGRQPYRSLAPYDVQDADLFVGRERLVAELASRVLKRRLVAVVGASGSGKSSLVRAGLIPLVRSGRLPGSGPWRTAVVVPGADPIATLDEVSGLDEPGSFLLVVDQFEEVFAAGSGEAVAARLIELSADAALDVRIVIVVRSDQYPALASVHRLADVVEDAQVLVGAPTAEELHRIVEVPARRTGCAVDPALIARVVDDVAGHDAALPLVSTALAEAWERRTDDTLTLDRYIELGGLAAAVERLGERAIARAGYAPIRDVMLRLVDVTDDGQWVRRRIPSADIPPDLAPAVDALADARIVQLDGGQVDVVHEVVFTAWPQLGRWLERMRTELVLDRELRRDAQAWDSAGRDADYLYRGVRLAAAEELLGRRDVAGLVEEFVLASTGAAERAAEERTRHQARVNRRLRGLLTGVGVLLVVALVAGALALRQADRADDSAAAAEAETLRAEAVGLGDRALATSEPDLALLLSVAGVKLDDAPETRANLLAVLGAHPGLFAPHRSRLKGVIASDPARGRLLSYAGGRLALHQVDTGDLLLKSDPVPVVRSWPHAEFSPDGHELAVLHEGHPADPATELTYGERPVVLYDADTLVPTSRQLGGVPRQAAGQEVAYSADGNFLAVSFTVKGASEANPSRSPVVVWDLRTPDAPLSTIIPKSRFNSVALSPDGRRLYAARYPEGDLRAYDVVTGKLRGDPVTSVGGRLAVSADGTTLAVAGLGDGQVTVVDGATLVIRARLHGHHVIPFGYPALSADGTRVAGEDGQIGYLWDVESKQPIEEFVGLTAFVNGFWFADDESVNAAAADDTLLRWDPDGGRRFVTSSQKLKDLRTVEWPLLLGDRRVAYVAGHLGLDYEGGFMQLQRLAERHVGPVLELDRSGIFSAAWRPDGRRIATIGTDGTVRVWNADSHTLDNEAELPRTRVNGPWLDYSRSGARIVVADDSGAVYALDANTLERVGKRYKGPNPLCSVVRGATDHITVALSCDDSGSILLVDVEHGRLQHEVKAGFSPWSAALSPDGSRLAVSGASGELRILDMEKMEWLGPTVVVDDADFASSIAWSEDGTKVASGSDTGKVALWDGTTGASLGAFTPGPDRTAVAVTFVPGGSELLAVSADGSTHTWDSDPRSWVKFACAVVARNLSPDEWKDAVGDRPYQKICATA